MLVLAPVCVRLKYLVLVFNNLYDYVSVFEVWPVLEFQVSVN